MSKGTAAVLVGGVLAVACANPGAVRSVPGVLADVPMLGGLVTAAVALTDAFDGAGEGDGSPTPNGRGEPDAGTDDSAGGGRSGIPSTYSVLYKRAATSSCVDWQVLAAIGQVESRHGANTGPSSAGALGPMQFMPATWRAYGRDGNGDGRKNVHDPEDAIPSAAGYLCDHGAARDLRRALWHYNHSWRYVDKVMAVADRLR